LKKKGDKIMSYHYVILDLKSMEIVSFRGKAKIFSSCKSAEDFADVKNIWDRKFICID
jgi:hypothetical protein